MKDKQAKYALKIAWLFPEHMSTYGDRGNITVLVNRLKWRGIKSIVLRVDFGTTADVLQSADFVFGGGAQDRQQTLVADDLRRSKGPALKQMLTAGIPGLFVCGAPQLFGRYYTTGQGERLDGVGILPIQTRHFGPDKPRLTGNLLIDVGENFRSGNLPYRHTVVGFENHGGRTFLDPGAQAFGTVITGSGNNGMDKTEGVFWKNCLATYSHGPLLSKNPHIADWLIDKALSVKYRSKAPKLQILDDTWEWHAHDLMVAKLTGRR